MISVPGPYSVCFQSPITREITWPISASPTSGSSRNTWFSPLSIIMSLLRSDICNLCRNCVMISCRWRASNDFDISTVNKIWNAMP